MKSLLRKLKPVRKDVDDDFTMEDDALVNPFSPEVQLQETSTETDAVSVEHDLSFDAGIDEPLDDPELLAADRKEGRFKTFLNAIPKPVLSGGAHLLAFQAGSFGLRGALVRDSKHSAILLAVAESRNVDFTRAIAEVLDKLKKSHKRLPKQAILITPSVVSSMVELPVSPLRPRSDEEMQELIRWELEGTLTQQNKHWLIGSMLVERGYLTPSQRDELVEELKIRQSQGGQDGLVRFGDLAVKLKYITQEQLEECFVLQGKLIAVDDDLAYGWQAEEPQLNQGLSDEVLLSAADDDGSAHKWLVSGMSKAVRRRWVGAFNLNGIRVQAFYPAVGAGFAALAQRSLDEEQALLEIHQEQLAFITGHPGSVQDIFVAERPNGFVRGEDLNKLMGVLPADLKTLHVIAPKEEFEDLQFTLSTITVVDAEHLTVENPELLNTDQVPDEALLSVIGASDHFLKHIQSARLSWISAREIETSLFKKLLQPKVFIGAGIVCVLTAMLGFLGWMHWNMWHQEARLSELEAKFERELKLKKQFGSIAADQARLKTEILHSQSEVIANDLLLEQLLKIRTREHVIASLLLRALSAVTPDQVYIDKLERNGPEIVIQAYAFDSTQGQIFINALNKVLKPTDYEVQHSKVEDVETAESLTYLIEVSVSLKNTDSSVVMQ